MECRQVNPSWDICLHKNVVFTKCCVCVCVVRYVRPSLSASGWREAYVDLSAANLVNFCCLYSGSLDETFN
jgi:hypothetical protein